MEMKGATTSDRVGQSIPQPSAKISDQSDSDIVDDDEGWYVPSRIFDEVKEGGKTNSLIKWEDWPLGAATIELRDNFAQIPALLEQ